MTKDEMRRKVVWTHPTKRHIWRECWERNGTWEKAGVTDAEWQEWLTAPQSLTE